MSPPPQPATEEKSVPLRILIVRTGAMGDVLHGLPAVAALRQQLPSCFVGWAVEPHWQGLLVPSLDQPGPVIDRVHPVPTRDWKRRPFSLATLREIAALRRELRRGQYDLCVDLQGSIRSALIGHLAGAGTLVGADTPRERPAAIFYRERVKTGSVHAIEQACDLLAAAVRVPTLRPAPVSLPQDEAAELWAADALRKINVREESRFIIIAPTAGWGAKMWPAQRFAELAADLSDAGYAVLVNAPESNDPTAAAICAASPAKLLPCSIAQLVALTRRAALVIGGDSGPVHLAAALGRPVVALFGPTDPARTGPSFPGANVTVLRHSESVVDHRRHSTAEAGLARISVDKVLRASLRLLESGHV